MKKYSKETAVGFFVLIGILCIAYLSIKLGNVQFFTDTHYPVHASFTDISGLKMNSPVQMYGVDIGYVSEIELDQKNGLANVTMMLRKDIKLTDDAIASIKTSGLIGDKFVKITPGGVGDPVPSGGTLTDTEPSINLEDLISKYVFGGIK